MVYAFIILLAAGIFLFAAFRKPSTSSDAVDHHSDDDMQTFNHVRARTDDVYASAWGKDNSDD